MENWKPVVGFEGIYEVSDMGRVKRIAQWSDGRKTMPGFLKMGGTKRYCRVILKSKSLGKWKQLGVHRMVMAAFIGGIPLDHEVNHKNGNKRDNRLENLEYVTHSENQIHSYRILKNPTRPGSKHHNAKVSEDDVFAMRALHIRGWSNKKICEEFHISPATVCWIIKRKSWNHI